MQMKKHLWKIGLIISNHISLNGAYTFRKGIGIILRIRSHLARFSLGEVLHRMIFFLIMLKNWAFSSPKLKDERLTWWFLGKHRMAYLTSLDCYMKNFINVFIRSNQRIVCLWSLRDRGLKSLKGKSGRRPLVKFKQVKAQLRRPGAILGVFSNIPRFLSLQINFKVS